jgi:ABC-type uncharacterized transport system permease subunit
MHVVGAGLAYALLSLALAQALLLGFQDKRLKQKQSLSLDMALPPIQTMEVTLFQMIYSGFGLLTLTLISGALSSNDMFGESFLFNHHTVLALLAWISLLGLVLGRTMSRLARPDRNRLDRSGIHPSGTGLFWLPICS